MSKRIGLDLRIYGTQHGGIGRYCEELFPRVLGIDQDNKYFGIVNKSSIQPEELATLKKIPNLEIIETNIRHYSIGEQISLLRILNRLNLDLVHFPNFNVPYLYKKPFVVTIHDMVHHKISGAKKSRYLHFLAYKKIMENAAQKASRIITVSAASKKDISVILNVPADKIEVVYEGSSIKTEISEEKVKEVKARYILKRPYFLFVGVMERKKNLVNLTRGFDAFLQKYGADMDLVIVGKSDSHYPEIKHKALDIKHSNRLVFTGQIEDYELEALYKGAYAFASASLHEGFGLPGVEALAFGLPLLVSNISVFNEIYDNAAIYFNPLDPEDIAAKMNLLVRDAQFYKQLQIKSFERSQNFDWDKTAQETLEIYKSAIK
ncbi:MAG TPA: glycosyltransferase family 1 protein [Candidatus Limnocylindria bacterium]|nr:glycosyltransferase family 1 protein [Candidatus Limnocylindria bacterium]